MKAVTAKRSLSTQLMRWVFGCYCFIAIAVTLFQMVKEYRHTQSEVVKELSRYQEIFGHVLARSIWDLDRERIGENLQALFSVPIVVGIKVIREGDEDVFMAKGVISENDKISFKYQPKGVNIEPVTKLLSYDFPLFYVFSGKEIKLANVTLYSDSNVVLSRVELGYLFLVVNAVIKSLALFIIFYFFAKYIVLTPLSSLRHRIHSINFDNLDEYDKDYEYSKVPNEIDELNSSFNLLVKELSSSKHEVLLIKKGLEDEVLSRTAELQTALDVKTRFLATMSHEIRTPMNGIIGTLDLMDKTTDLKKHKYYNRLAKESALTLLSLVNDILDFSKIESGRMELELRPFDIHYLVRSIYENYKLQIKDKNIDLELEEYNLTNKWLIGDSIRLKQVISNLLNNAIKFTIEGKVTFQVILEEIQSHYELIVSIKDTGIGIDQDAIDNLFRDFTQADTSTTRRFGGTGLGLAIVKQLVEMMGGRIQVNSQIGEGSHFCVSIPFQESKEHQSVKDLTSNLKLNQFQGKILLVEDNLINQEVAKEILSDFKLSVVIASNGEEALEKLNKESFDLVLMDCQMPILDGYDATKAIRSGQANQANIDNTQVPIVAMTANAVDGDKEKCIACGMDDYLSKPIDVQALSRVLECYLDSTVHSQD